MRDNGGAQAGSRVNNVNYEIGIMHVYDYDGSNGEGYDVTTSYVYNPKS